MEESGAGVRDSVRRLCRCLLDVAVASASHGDALLASLQPPSTRDAWNWQERDSQERALLYIAYDILLLKKWAWFGSWGATPLSPFCRCVAYGYEYHQSGRGREAERLNRALQAFSGNCGALREKDAILKFLWLLSGGVAEQPAPLTQLLDSSVDSGVFCYDLYPSSVFEQLPVCGQLAPVSQALQDSSALFACTPGSGFRGFLSAECLEPDKTLAASSLFDGLTSSTTASLNSALHIPTLPSHPDLLFQQLGPLHGSLSVTGFPPSPPASPPTSPTHSVWSEALRDDIILPARGWEGWQHSRPYLSEAGADSLGHAHFLSGAHLPPGAARPHPPVPRPLLDALTVEGVERWAEGDSVARAFGSALSRLLVYGQTLADAFHQGTAVEQSIGSQALEPLLHLLAAERDSHPQGLPLLDLLYSQCCSIQGTPHYSLLLPLLSLSITSYTHFVSQWVFRGWLDEREQFGIHSNHHALQCRDHHYWADGYVATNQCTPTFLSQHRHTLLACGKAINLLHLCCPKHPLCGRVASPPPVTIATSLEQLELLTQQCQDYHDHVCQLVEADRRQQQLETEALERDAMREVLQARRDARQALQTAREEEQQLLRQQEEGRRVWYQELKTRAQEARQVRAEERAEERKRDRELVAALASKDDSLTGHERRLAEEARAELVAHYQVLGQQADLRRVRAEWREARLALTSKRQQWLEGEGERWEKKEEEEEEEEEEAEEKEEAEEEEEEAKEERGVQNSTFERGRREEGMSVENSPSPGEGGQLASLSAPATPSEDTLLETEQQREQQQSSVPALPREPSVPAPQASSGDASSSAVVSGASSASLPHTRSTRGHAPPATIQDLIYPPADGAPVPHVQSSRGHAPPDGAPVPHVQSSWGHAPPDGAPVPHVQSSRGHAPPSTIQHLLYPLTSDLPVPHVQSSRGHAPLSTIQHLLCSLTSDLPVPHVQSSRGHAPSSTIQHLLYPLTSDLPAHLATASPAAPPLPPPGGWPASSEDPLHMPAPLPYTLDYLQLDELPQGDLLTPILGPIPVQSGMEADCLLLPLPSLLNHALSLPLLTQSHLVNSALLEHYLTSCHMTSHFLSLKRFLLLEDGEFAHSLATRLFHQLLYGGPSVRLASPAFLNPLLQAALDSSLHGDSPHAQLLSFVITRSRTPIQPHAVDALDFLDLQYKVEWPCNIVITDADLKKYNKIFHLLLQLRRASWALKNVFTQLQRCEGLEKWQHRELQIHRHELQHFVDVMQGYITNQLFYLSWGELEEDLASKVHSLDDLITAHHNFIDKAIFRCLLSKKAAAVMAIIRNIFSSILRFCATLTSPIHPSPHHHHHTMCRTHRKFRETTGLLMKVISKLVQRGYQPHLEDFLLRLNFNGFYG